MSMSIWSHVLHPSSTLHEKTVEVLQQKRFKIPQSRITWNSVAGLIAKEMDYGDRQQGGEVSMSALHPG